MYIVQKEWKPNEFILRADLQLTNFTHRAIHIVSFSIWILHTKSDVQKVYAGRYAMRVRSVEFSGMQKKKSKQKKFKQKRNERQSAEPR